MVDSIALAMVNRNGINFRGLSHEVELLTKNDRKERIKTAQTKSNVWLNPILRTVLVKVLETPILPSTFTLTLNPSPKRGEGLQSDSPSPKKGEGVRG